MTSTPKAPAVTRWAIKWSNGRSAHIDHRTVSTTRAEAWKRHVEEISPHATPSWLAKLKRKRRNGEIRAVKIRIEEITNG